MKKFDIRWSTLIVFTVMLLGWWYWYEYRPQNIRQECTRYTIEESMYFHDKIDLYQKECVDAGGLDNYKKALDNGSSVTSTD